MSIEIRGITKTFGRFTALREINLTIPSGELVALLGPSGCGKTTLLRVIAGLEAAERGEILFNGQSAARRRVRDRGVGFVFQHYALFRHMTVFQNVSFGLDVRPSQVRLPKDQIKERVMKLLRLVQVEHLANHYPSELSGGQRQRVALARALAVEPELLLLDEPFGALDAKVRKELRRWLRRLHDDIHVTSVFVTHDQEEALEVSDRIVVMNEGHIEQVGTPEEVYHHPGSAFVCHFLGDVNLFHARTGDGLPGLSAAALVPPDTSAQAGTADIYVRPHMVTISRQPGPGLLQARVEHVNAAGPTAKVELLTPAGDIVTAEISQAEYRQLGLQRSQTVFLGARDPKALMADYSI